MRFRGTWPILLSAFGSLLLLIGVSSLVTLRKASEHYQTLADLNEPYRQVETALGGIQSDIQVSNILVRDYLLDPSQILGEFYRKRILQTRESIEDRLDVLESAGLDSEGRIDRLRHEMDTYWKSLEPIFAWTPAQKMALSYLFLRRQIMPRRDTVLQLASEIQILNQENLRRQQRARAEAFRQFSAFLRQMLLISLALGCGIAFLGAWRVLQLEGRVEKQLARTQEAEEALRQLSQELVHAQEEERRQLSRELHDEVGQILTGLRMELMSLTKYQDAPRPRFEARLQELRGSLEQTVRSVRDLAMGLRPSMLDDLGLKPALEWQAREFSRRHGIPVTLRVEAPLEPLPENHRTAIYRVVQEALTNCARHARAHSIDVDLRQVGNQLRVVVADDGVGMPSGGRRSGLGLLGIEERAREIGGRAWVESRPGAGTAMTFEAPLTAENVHVEDAHPARG